MKNINYCKSWFRAKKKPVEIWSEQKAHKAHQSRNQYTVLIGELNCPDLFIEVNDDFMGVCFLDDEAREYMTYQFHLINKEELFLETVIYREFIDQTDEVSKATIYAFNVNGSVNIRKESFNPYKAEFVETVKDVSCNYEKYPEFGDYSNLVAIDRN